jgi:rubrerythrin
MKTRRWSPVVGWCHKTGKQQHTSRAGAKAQREGIRKRKGAADGLEVYTCPHCGYFHIGHGHKKQAGETL